MSSAATPESISTLYQDHHGWLLAWLGREVGCSQQAADLAQDTLTFSVLGSSPSRSFLVVLIAKLPD
ncbi:hypothetical protein [Pseudothauera nasutitermitis]|uniref:hypothetical protein n=1 Tax=Pseudothauera nasutitermitis TaxID=2565930 RepID=UPI001B3B25F9|nr:hypothetical protein [Pseudothauera nasutitermitis]